MLARVRTAALWGLDAFPVDCEVDVGPGLPGFVMVGLPDATAREARERVWPALRNAGLTPPDRRVDGEPAPPPIAGRRAHQPTSRWRWGLSSPPSRRRSTRFEHARRSGEVALDGTLRGTRGTLSLAEACGAQVRAHSCARRRPRPRQHSSRALAVLRRAPPGLEAVAWLRGDELSRAGPPPDPHAEREDDLSDVRGQAVARRALEIAAAGGHHVLLVGPPGCGKSMLATRLRRCAAPPLEHAEALVVTRLHSAVGLRAPGRGLMRTPAVPLAASLGVAARGLVGGGNPPRPGELSLAHRGVLFLDELAEYQRSLLDALREPLEERRGRHRACRCTPASPRGAHRGGDESVSPAAGSGILSAAAAADRARPACATPRV